MTYGIAIWGFRAKSQVVCKRFDKVIRDFGIQATRCFRTTSSEFIFSLLRTSKFQTILQNEVLKTSIQQLHVTSTKRYKVYETYAKLRKTRIVPQCMDHHFFLTRKGQEENLKRIQFDDPNKQYEAHPSRWAPTNTKIESSSIAMMKASNQTGWIFYTDASKSTHGLAWSVLIFKNGFCINRKYGAISFGSVFLAEAYAVLKAVEGIKNIQNLRTNEEVEIRTDSQALVKVLDRTHHDNELLFNIKSKLQEAYHRGVKIVLRWAPAHQGIYGNESADLLAKKATDSRSVTENKLTNQDFKNICQKRKKTMEVENWNDFSSKNVKLFLPDMEIVSKFIRSSPSTPLCQIVSGHSRLNDFIYGKLGLINSPKCKCGKDRETVSHFLFDCCLYKDLRNEIWEDFSLEYSFISKDWQKLNQFVVRTGRFEGNMRDMLLNEQSN